MRRLVGWLLTAALFACVGGLLTYTWLETRAEHGEHEPAASEPSESGEPARLTHLPSGEVVVFLDEGSRRRAGIEAVALEAMTRRPELIAYGVLREDPASTFTLRAPVPGILHAGEEEWPHVGTQLDANAQVGTVAPRLSPVERADLLSRLATAHAEVEEARASLMAARASYQGKRDLNADDKMVSDRALEEAAAKVKVEEARLAGAEEAVRVYESSLTASTGPAGPLPLTVAQAGQVIQISAQPGEAVESGQILLQLGSFRSLLARIDLPAGQLLPPEQHEARIVVPGREEALAAERLAPAPSADPRTTGNSVLFRVTLSDGVLQPGIPVIAYIPLPGDPQSGFIIPRDSLVRMAGKAWAYVELEEGRYTRREVPTDVPLEKGFFVSGGFEPNRRIVARGAQLLLAEESGFQVREEEE